MNYEVFSECAALAEQKSYRRLRERLAEQNEIDVAEFLETLPLLDAAVVFRTLPKDMSAEVFANLDADTQEHIIRSSTDGDIAELIEDLFVDDAVDILEELPAGVVKKVLKNATSKTRQLINRFLNYPADSAGSVMTAEFVELDGSLSAAEAINVIRRTGVDKETVYTCYVIDGTRHLLGVISFRDLIFAAKNAVVEDIMTRDPIFCNTHDDRETAAELLAKYDLQAIPVIDAENRVCGIITYDDAFDVIEQEATEDFHKFAAVAAIKKPYLETSVISLAAHRIPWLMVLMLASIFSGLVIDQYEVAIGAVPLLVSFIPVITDTCGNCGAQSSTLITRALALGELSLASWYRVMLKELCVALMCGVTLAAVNLVRVLIFNPQSAAVAIAVALSLLLAVIMSKTIGAMLPLIAKLLKLDPAVMAAPLITTVVDTLSLLIYFAIASALVAM